MILKRILLIVLLACIGWGLPAWGQETREKPQEEKKPITIEVADGAMELTSPGEWEKVEPRSNLLDAEFKIPRVESDPADGRLTVMGAGGSVRANVDRWLGQFDGPAKLDQEEMEVAGKKVTLVDISGDFMEGMGGPFGPKQKREDYRMLGAIIETEDVGLYFIKLTGPQPTIQANVERFKGFVKSLKMK